MTPRAGTRECQKCKKNRQLRFFKPAGRICLTCQRGRTKVVSHELRVQKTYGLLPGEYEAIVASQGGVCAICKQPRTYNLHVDHDHKVERETGDSRRSVRGGCCRRCNKVLAVVGDSRSLLAAAIEYLASWPSSAILGDDVQGYTANR